MNIIYIPWSLLKIFAFHLNLINHPKPRFVTCDCEYTYLITCKLVHKRTVSQRRQKYTYLGRRIIHESTMKNK